MKDLFSTASQKYATYRPTYPLELFDFIYPHVKTPTNAWDCGTGNGQIARFLSQHFQEVYATDISGEQLKYAPPSANIHYSIQQAEHSTFPDQYFDLILVAQAIHWFYFDKFYSEVKRTLKKGEIFGAVGYELVTVNEKIDDIVNHFYHNIVGPYWEPERHHLETSYQSIPFPFEEIKTPDFTTKAYWTVEHFLGYLSTWSAVKKYKAANILDPVKLIEAELKAIWMDELEVRFPIFMRLGRNV